MLRIKFWIHTYDLIVRFTKFIFLSILAGLGIPRRKFFLWSAGEAPNGHRFCNRPTNRFPIIILHGIIKRILANFRRSLDQSGGDVDQAFAKVL
jgi:hypothetical protein